MIEQGDSHAKLIYQAFAYGIAKGIGDLATVVNARWIELSLRAA